MPSQRILSSISYKNPILCNSLIFHPTGDSMPEKNYNDKSIKSFKEEVVTDDRLRKFILREQRKMGAFSLGEFLMLISFILLVLAWLFRDPKIFEGWGQFLDGITNNGSKVNPLFIHGWRRNSNQQKGFTHLVTCLKK